MKQSEIAMLILVVSIALVASYFVGNALFGGTENRTAQVEVVNPIETEFSQPDPNIFNEDAINLVEQIDIGETNTENPFADEE